MFRTIRWWIGMAALALPGCGVEPERRGEPVAGEDAGAEGPDNGAVGEPDSAAPGEDAGAEGPDNGAVGEDDYVTGTPSGALGIWEEPNSTDDDGATGLGSFALQENAWWFAQLAITDNSVLIKRFHPDAVAGGSAGAPNYEATFTALDFALEPQGRVGVGVTPHVYSATRSGARWVEASDNEWWVVDAENPKQPTFAKVALPGPMYCSRLAVVGDHAYCFDSDTVLDIQLP